MVRAKSRISDDEYSTVLYSAVVSFALWKPGWKARGESYRMREPSSFSPEPHTGSPIPGGCHKVLMRVAPLEEMKWPVER